MKIIFDILKNNLRYILLKALGLSLTISTVLSIYELSLAKIIDNNAPFIKVIGILSLVFFGLYLLSFLGVWVYLTFRNKITLFTTDKHSIYLHFKDFFDNEIVNNKSIHKNIVINANRCFDTIVDNVLISEKTIHGKVFKTLYEENKFTKEALQDKINDLLINETFESLQKEDKPQGNLRRYPVGTMIKINDSTSKTYYLLGMSSFDKELNAHTSKEDFIISIQRLIEYCDKNSQGNCVLLPLLGAGLSRTMIYSYSYILKYIVAAFKINSDIINCDFHIFVHPDDKGKINFGDL